MIWKVECNDGTMDEGNPTKAPCVNNGGIKPINFDLSKPFLGKPDLSQQIAQQQAQLEIARQQALMQAVAQVKTYSGVTDKVFGKEGGWSFERPMRIGAYIIIGAVVGRYVAKNMGKSTTLGMVVGGLAPLLALKLTMEYDKRNMPKQEPRQKVAIEPTPMPKISGLAMPVVETDWQKLSKTPNEFVVKSNGFNTRYYKNIDKTLTGFASSFSVPDLYKQPFSTNGIGGVQPTKITSAEFLNAYNEFLKQPK
jgi:hypothetical protein